MSFSRNLSYLCCFILLTLISSCSSTHQAYLRTLQLAFDKSQDIELQTSDIRQSPADLIYVKKADFPIIVLALAFIEKGEYKWISSDKAALIEKDGRIIKTLALDHNLDFVTANSADPLAHYADINHSSSWQRQIDFDKQYFGVPLNSSFSEKKLQTLTIQENNIETVLIEERVAVKDSNIHRFTENEWLNQFWFDKNSGKLLRSRQKAIPGGDYFDITYVSRALRL